MLLLAGFLAAAQKDTTLHEYKGTYLFPAGSATPSVDISVEENTLHATSSIGSASLTKISKDTFSIPTFAGMAYFYRDDSGKVKGIRVEVGDLVLIGDKEKNGPSAFRRPRFFGVR